MSLSPTVPSSRPTEPSFDCTDRSKSVSILLFFQFPVLITIGAGQARRGKAQPTQLNSRYRIHQVSSDKFIHLMMILI